MLVAALFGGASVAGAQEKRSFASVLSYQTVRVADGIYAFITPEERSGFQAGNSIAIVGDDGVLIVDSGNLPVMTRRQIAEVRKLTDKPVRYLVNTHWHPDHTLGNAEYRAAFPNIVIVSTAATRMNMVARMPVYFDQMRSFAPTDTLMRKMLAEGKTPKGTPLSEAQRVMWKLNVDDYAEFFPEVMKGRLEAPNLVFDDSLTIMLGARAVKIVHPGRGNTAGDAYIYVPDAKTVMTGDLLTMPAPFAFGSFLGDWVKDLDQVKSLNATSIVPGHGMVQHDYQYLDLVRELLVYTREKVHDAVLQGLSLEETRKRVDLTEFRNRFSGGDLVRADGFNSWFVPIGVERAYDEAKFLIEGPIPRK